VRASSCADSLGVVAGVDLEEMSLTDRKGGGGDFGTAPCFTYTLPDSDSRAHRTSELYRL
jgi:hypothetical protein